MAATREACLGILSRGLTSHTVGPCPHGIQGLPRGYFPKYVHYFFVPGLAQGLAGIGS